MVCYRLQSCNPTQYPDINNLCIDEGVLADTNKTVYINGDNTKLYRLVLVGLNACVCQQPLPPYTVSNLACGEEEVLNAYVGVNCTDPNDVKDFRNQGLPILVGYIVEIEETEFCYTITGTLASSNQDIFTVNKIIDDCLDCKTGTYYKLVDCEGLQNPIDAEVLDPTISLGDVIKVVELEGCWTVSAITAEKSVTLTLSYIYGDCATCLSEVRRFYNVLSCDGLETNTVEIVGGAVEVGDVITVGENRICWSVISEVQAASNVFTLTGNISECSKCPEVPEDCKEDGERTLAYATLVTLPDLPIPDKGFKECCYTNLVLADKSDDDPYKNDFTGFYFQKQTSNDNCHFVLHELATGDTFGLDSGVYGVFKDFGDISDQPNLTTYILQWRNVLSVLGTGLYRVESVITIAGLSFSKMSNTFTLEHFTDDRADKGVRIDTKMDGELVHLGVNFKGSGFVTGVRTKGFFGRRNPKYKQDNLVKRNYETVQISMSQENEYQLQAGLIPECITSEIYDFILFGNELFISDYNLTNHSYKYRLTEVELDSNKGSKYYTTNRDSRLNLTFTDRVKNKRKVNC